MNLTIFFLFISFLTNCAYGEILKEQTQYEFASLFDFSKNGRKRFEIKFHDYVVRLSRKYVLEDFEIRKAGKVVFNGNKDNALFETFYLLFQAKKAQKEFVLNLTGGGKSQIGILAMTGGSSGEGTLFIFDLGEEFKKIARVVNMSDDPKLIDLDGDGIPEIVIQDSAFTYTFGRANRPDGGTVVLKYRDGKYVMADDLMQKPLPGEATIENWKKEWAKDFIEMDELEELHPPTDFMQALTELIYTGHADRAMKFINQVWPPEILRKEQFINAYREALSESIYYSKAAKDLR